MTTADCNGAVPAAPGPSDPSSRPGRPWRALGATGSVLGGEGLVTVHPAFGEVMAAGDVVVLCIAVVLVAAILVGDDQACERAVRLLRWVADRPEPPATGLARQD